LPSRRQRIIELRHRRWLSYAEIGEELDLTEAAARKLWSRTVEDLRKALSADHAERPTQPR
jgi:DNA-directed RNA polymerase specialized sigma24 family protein